jgi:reactive chlorine resistance protein C
MKTVFQFVERIAPFFLRFSLALVLLWIGALKFADPSPVRGLLAASLPFLAFNAFVYVLGALEIIAAVLLFAGVWLRYVGLLCLILFAGTLTIFVITPGVTGFPLLTLTGQFLLKDVVLAAAAVSVAATDAAKQTSKQYAVQMGS